MTRPVVVAITLCILTSCTGGNQDRGCGDTDYRRLTSDVSRFPDFNISEINPETLNFIESCYALNPYHNIIDGISISGAKYSDDGSIYIFYELESATDVEIVFMLDRNGGDILRRYQHSTLIN